MALDFEIKRIEAQLSTMAPTSVGLFSCSAAERLLPLYQAFASENGWGDYAKLRSILDALWDYNGGKCNSNPPFGLWLEEILKATPHADDFDSLLITSAQDTCICLDLAVRWTGSIEKDRSYAMTEYSLEGWRQLICYRETGYIDLGSGPEAAAFELQLLEHPFISAELARQHEDIATLQSQEEISQFVATLKDRARQHRADAKEWKTKH